MSADNGIYILVSPHRTIPKLKEYRVAYGMAIDNLWYNEDGSDELNMTEVIRYFQDSNVHNDPIHAWNEARIESKKYTILEYGVSEIKIDRPYGH